MKRIVAVTSLILLFVLLAFAADFWTKKPYTQWSNKEVKQMLSDSPWAKNQTLRHAQLSAAGGRGFGEFSDRTASGEAQGGPEIVYTVYLRTARPIREALVRKAQLDQKYDRLDDAKKKEFDANYGKFLADQFSDRIIFQVVYSSNTTEVDRQLATYWQNQSLETMQNLVAAMNTPDGQHIAPIAFWVGKGGAREFQLAFPRPSGDYPPNSAISLEFGHPDVTGEPATRMFFKFPLKDMQYNGNLAF